MVWTNHSSSDWTVKDTGNELKIFSTVTDYETIPAQVEYVDATNHLLQRLGLRPDVDLIAYVPYDTECKHGWTVEWRSKRYAVYKVEQGDRDATIRLVLKEMGETSTSGIDLDT